MLKLVSGPTAEPVSLTEAKAWLRVTDSNSDTLITQLIASARQSVEMFTHRILVAQTWEQYLDQFPPGDSISLGLYPYRSITHIKYYDTDGTLQTVDSADYQTHPVFIPPRVTPIYGGNWPSSRGWINDVVVRFIAGDAVSISADASTDVITATGHGYTDGDLVRFWNTGGALPTGLSANTDYYVRDATATTFKVSANSGGAAVDITGAGTGTNFAGDIPRALIDGLLLLVAHWYDNRQTMIVGNIVNEAPINVQSVLMPYRVFEF